MIFKRNPTGRTPTVTTGEKRRILKPSVQQSPKPQQSPRFGEGDCESFFLFKPNLQKINVRFPSDFPEMTTSPQNAIC